MHILLQNHREGQQAVFLETFQDNLGVHSAECMGAILHLSEVNELLEEVVLGPGGAGGGGGQVEVAGDLGNQCRVAIVLAIPARSSSSAPALRCAGHESPGNGQLH